MLAVHDHKRIRKVRRQAEFSLLFTHNLRKIRDRRSGIDIGTSLAMHPTRDRNTSHRFSAAADLSGFDCDLPNEKANRPKHVQSRALSWSPSIASSLAWFSAKADVSSWLS
jgi:hypothetical protein